MEAGRVNQYLGKYVSVYLENFQINLIGKVDRIEHGCVILKPYSGGVVTDNGIERKLIEDREESISLDKIVVISPTTEEDIKKYLRNDNIKNGIEKPEEKAGF